MMQTGTLQWSERSEESRNANNTIRDDCDGIDLVVLDTHTGTRLRQLIDQLLSQPRRFAEWMEHNMSSSLTVSEHCLRLLRSRGFVSTGSVLFLFYFSKQETQEEPGRNNTGAFGSSVNPSAALEGNKTLKSCHAPRRNRREVDPSHPNKPTPKANKPHTALQQHIPLD